MSDFNSFTEEFVDLFNSITVTILNNSINVPRDCPDSNISLSQTLYVHTENLKHCTFVVDQTQEMQGVKICANIPLVIKSKSRTEIDNLFFNNSDSIFNKTVISLNSKYNLLSKTEFLDNLKRVVKDQIDSYFSSPDSLCNDSNINITQTSSQDILLKDINCQPDPSKPASSITIDSRSILNLMVQCMVGGLSNSIKFDTKLSKSFSPSFSPCVYDLIPSSECVNDRRDYKIKIWKKDSNNECRDGSQYLIDGDIVKKECNIPQCEVSEWRDWSDCKNNTQVKSRVITKYGINCPSFYEVRSCNVLESRPRVSQSNVEQDSNGGFKSLFLNNGMILLLITTIIVIVMFML